MADESITRPKSAWLTTKVSVIPGTAGRQLYLKATADEKSVLKGSRWLLLKNPENLNEGAHLAAALELNEPLAQGYYLREELRLFWEETFRWPAQLFLRSWCRRAIATGLATLTDDGQNTDAT